MIVQKLKTGICKRCGNNKIIINKSKGLCLYCNNLASIKRSRERRLIRIQKGLVVDLNKVNKFYKKFWDSQTIKNCYETDVPLYTYNKWHVHHVLPKKQYPQYVYNLDICVLLSLQQHDLWHKLTDKDREIKMPKTYSKYLELKQKYNIQ